MKKKKIITVVSFIFLSFAIIFIADIQKKVFAKEFETNDIKDNALPYKEINHKVEDIDDYRVISSELEFESDEEHEKYIKKLQEKIKSKPKDKNNILIEEDEN